MALTLTSVAKFEILQGLNLYIEDAKAKYYSEIEPFLPGEKSW